MCTEIQVLDRLLFNFRIFTAAAYHHCTCFRFPIIRIFKKPTKILIFTFCASKASITITRIEEGAPLNIIILTWQLLINLKIQIPVFAGLVIFDVWSCFNTTFLLACQVSLNLLKSIRTIIKRCLVRLISNRIRDILGVHVWALLVDGTIQPMIPMEIKVQ